MPEKWKIKQFNKPTFLVSKKIIKNVLLFIIQR